MEETPWEQDPREPPPPQARGLAEWRGNYTRGVTPRPASRVQPCGTSRVSLHSGQNILARQNCLMNGQYKQ